jgi:hypothetical protein
MGRTQRAVEFAFGVLARWRSGRAVHTRGTAVDATLTIDPGSATGRALGGPRSRPAVVRASKSIGLPGRIPDLLGMALRISAGNDGLIDVLLASTGRRGLAHMALLPSGNWWGRPYSTVLPYVVDGRRLVLGLEADAGIVPAGADPADVTTAVRNGPVAFTVSEMPVLGERRAIGRLVLESVREDGPSITFDPILNALPRLHPVRPLSALREWAYTGSRRGRAAEPASLRRRPDDAIDRRPPGSDDRDHDGRLGTGQ